MRGGGKGREGEGFEEGRREMEEVKGRDTERGDAREKRLDQQAKGGWGGSDLSARARERGRGASGSLRHRRWRMRRGKKRQTAVRE